MRVAVPAPGTTIWIRRRRWQVERARLDRGIVCLDVRDRQHRLTFLAPFDRPVLRPRRARPVVVRAQQARARLAHLVASTYSLDTVRVASRARVDLWPHQFEPVLAVLRGHRRLLLADEVGLGKTIQAGLVIAELSLRRPGFRALVIVPAALRAQWAHELEDRFGIRALLADRSDLDEAARSGSCWDNPWQRSGVWLVSLDYLKQRHVFEAMPIDPWDVVVVDEAHGACGHTDRHLVSDELGRRARHLLLLSATPHSGDESRFQRLLTMGALGHSADDLLVFRRTRTALGLTGNRVVRWPRLTCGPHWRRLMDALAGYERSVLRQARPGRRDAALLLLSIFRKRALSTIHALDRSLARRLEWLEAPERAYAFDWLQPRLDFSDDADDVGDEEKKSMMADVGVPATQERTWLRRLRLLARQAVDDESKVRWLCSAAARTTESMVIFTEFRHSLEHLQPLLARHRVVATLHGGQPEAVRASELDRFRRGEATVLIATDAGGQGLNLQMASRWVISLELPWNPVRLEQRIGRVDRIGQTRRVHATMIRAGHSAEDTVLSGIVRRALVARAALGSDALADLAPPNELSVAAAVIGQAPLLPLVSPSRGPKATVEFRRRARAIVRQVQVKRRLNACWRGPLVTGRPVVTRGRVLTGFTVPAAGCLSIWCVPVVDGTGEVVARYLVAIGFLGIGVPGTPAATRAIEAEAVRVCRARLRRLSAIARVSGERRQAAERAIALHLHTLRKPEEAQLGMFSQREARAFEAARLASALAADDVAGRVQYELDAMRLELGRPSLEWARWS